MGRMSETVDLLLAGDVRIWPASSCRLVLWFRSSQARVSQFDANFGIGPFETRLHNEKNEEGRCQHLVRPPATRTGITAAVNAECPPRAPTFKPLTWKMCAGAPAKPLRPRDNLGDTMARVW